MIDKLHNKVTYTGQLSSFSICVVLQCDYLKNGTDSYFWSKLTITYNSEV